MVFSARSSSIHPSTIRGRGQRTGTDHSVNATYFIRRRPRTSRQDFINSCHTSHKTSHPMHLKGAKLIELSPDYQSIATWGHLTQQHTWNCLRAVRFLHCRTLLVFSSRAPTLSFLAHFMRHLVCCALNTQPPREYLFNERYPDSIANRLWPRAYAPLARNKYSPFPR